MQDDVCVITHALIGTPHGLLAFGKPTILRVGATA